MKKIIFVCFLVVLASCKPPLAEPKYNYQTIKRELPYTDWKKDRASAEKKVKYEVNFYSKDACRRIAYGWVLHKTKNPGVMECQESAEGHHCRFNKIELECRKITERKL